MALGLEIEFLAEFLGGKIGADSGHILIEN
jgi:hypothetical protein